MGGSHLVCFFSAILLGYVICTLNSSRTASITFFLFATLSLLNHPVLSLLFLLGIGSMGITRRGKRKPSFHISGLSLCRKDNGRDFFFKFPFLFHSGARSIRRARGYFAFIPLLYYYITFVRYHIFKMKTTGHRAGWMPPMEMT